MKKRLLKNPYLFCFCLIGQWILFYPFIFMNASQAKVKEEESPIPHPCIREKFVIDIKNDAGKDLGQSLAKLKVFEERQNNNSVIQRFSLEKFLTENKDVDLVLKNGKKIKFSDFLQRKNLVIPDFIKNLDGQDILYLQTGTKDQKQPYVITPIPLKQITIEKDGDQRTLQECLEKGLLDKKQIVLELQKFLADMEKKIEAKAVQSLDSSVDKKINPQAIGMAQTTQITRFAPIGPGEEVVLIHDNYAKMKFDEWLLRGFLTFNNIDIDSGKSVSGYVGGNAKYLQGSVTQSDDNQSLGARLIYMYGFPMLSFNGKWDLQNEYLDGAAGKESIQGMVAMPFWNNWISLYGGVGFNFGTKDAVFLGGSVTAIRDRTVNYLGPYNGKIPELQGLHGLVVGDKKGIGGFLDLGVFSTLTSLSLGVRGGFYKNTLHQYRTHLPLKIIQKYLKDRKKWNLFRFFRRPLLQGLPNIKEPLKLMPEDEVTYTTEREAFGLLSVGLQPIPGFLDALKVGGLKTVTVKYQTKVKKLAGNKVEVVISDMKISNFSLFFRLIQLFGINYTKSLELADSQTLVFDLENPEALKMYQELIFGKVPSFFAAAKKNRGKKDVSPLMSAFEKDTQEMKEKGVTRTQLETVVLPFSKFSANAKILWLPPSVLPGLSYEKVQGKGYTITTDGNYGLKKFIDINSVRKEKMINEESSSVSSVARGLYSKDHNHLKFKFVDLRLVSFQEETKSDLKANNKKIFNLNDNFNLHLHPFQSSVKKEIRKVTVEKILTLEDLQVLSNFSNEDAEKIALLTKLEKKSILKLRNLLKGRKIADQVRVVQNFIHGKGRDGLKVVHLLLGGDISKLKIMSESSVYQDSMQRAKDLVAKYLDPETSLEKTPRIWLNSRSLPRNVKKFYKKVSDAIDKLDEAIKFLENDPYFPSVKDNVYFLIPEKQNREEVQKHLTEAKETLLYLLDFKAQGIDEKESGILERKIGLVKKIKGKLK